MATGSVKKVVSERGFGFIAADDGKEYFFHRSGLDSSLDFDRLSGGEKVEFEIESSPKGPRAAKIRAADIDMVSIVTIPVSAKAAYTLINSCWLVAVLKPAPAA